MHYFKLKSIEQAMISEQTFYSMVFLDKNADIILEVLKRHLKPRRAKSVLPKIQINPISFLIPHNNPQIRSFKLHTKSNKTNFNPEDFLNLISQWWDNQDIEKNGILPASQLQELLTLKGISANSSEAKKLLPHNPVIQKSSFFAIFIQAILKLELVKISEKLSKSKKFIPINKQLLSIKRRFLIPKLSRKVIDTHRENLFKHRPIPQNLSSLSS